MATKYITLDNLTVFLENLQSSTEKKFVATADVFGGIRTGFSGRSNNYAVQLNDDDGKAYVYVPWENTTYTAKDGLTINNSTINLNFDNTQHNYTPITIGSQVKDRHYAVQLDKNGKIAVYVPHTDTKVTQSNKHYKPNNASQSKSLGIYKYSVDGAGHLYNISVATADDIIKICPELKKIQDVIQVAKEISWSDLIVARDKGNLVPGQQYRIIDYTTKIYDDGFWATAGHDFDVIVEAISNNELSEFAKAAPRAGDTYFSGCNLSAWELKYCIDNNDNRFEMIADTQNGKGVIYYMKDERNNEAPCDFKNVLYKINNKNYYIFSCYNTDNNQIFDASVKGLKNAGYPYPSDNSICVDNIFGTVYAIFIIFYNANTNEEIIVNNNIIRGNIVDESSTYKVFINNNYNNIIERKYSGGGPMIFKNSHDNFIECGGDGGYIYIGCDNIPSDWIDDFSKFKDTIINNNTYNNTIGRNCHNIQLKSGCYNNIFEFCCCNIKLEKNCHNNVFGICTSNLKLNENSSYNKSVDFSQSYGAPATGENGLNMAYGIYCNATTGVTPILERCTLGRNFWGDNIYFQNIKPDSTNSNIKNMFNSNSTFKYQNYKIKNLEFVNLGTSQQFEFDYNLFNVWDMKIIRNSGEIVGGLGNSALKLIGENKFQD